jgi:hypothetical protein
MVQPMSILSEYVHFLRSRKKLWMLPLLLVMLGLGAVAVFGQGSALMPFIYAVF